jgi:hypothetical protein
MIAFGIGFFIGCVFQAPAFVRFFGGQTQSGLAAIGTTVIIISLLLHLKVL